MIERNPSSNWIWTREFENVIWFCSQRPERKKESTKFDFDEVENGRNRKNAQRKEKIKRISSEIGKQMEKIIETDARSEPTESHKMLMKKKSERRRTKIDTAKRCFLCSFSLFFDQFLLFIYHFDRNKWFRRRQIASLRVSFRFVSINKKSAFYLFVCFFLKTKKKNLFIFSSNQSKAENKIKIFDFVPSKFQVNENEKKKMENQQKMQHEAAVIGDKFKLHRKNGDEDADRNVSAE